MNHEGGNRELRWLDWAREIEALAAASRHYAQNDFERERAARLQEIAAEIIAAHSTLSAPECLEAFQAQPGYVTPKVDVRGAVVEDGRLLMVREALDGAWTLPGGWADVGEPPALAAEREVLEEAGLQVRARRLIGVYDANRVEGALPLFHAYKLVFLCEGVGGELATSKETTEVAFFPLDQIPEPLSPYRTTPRLLEDLRRSLRELDRPTVFD
jgi:ADP-ribose pyrophosphatase YjhB (NUDIX family)